MKPSSFAFGLLLSAFVAGAESLPAEPSQGATSAVSKPEDNPGFFDILTKPAPPTARVAANETTAEEPRTHSLNDLIVATIKNDMPEGGGYATNASSFEALRTATAVENGRLVVQPTMAKPNFCSGATYLVFLSVLEKLQRTGKLQLDPTTLEQLPVRGQPDGSGLWGRWNANGPGTARLFHELKLGRNFASYSEAKPGDFVKLFWNDGIGSTERGHSAIFLGLEREPSGQEFVSYWSSNQSDGFGYMRKERSKIKRVLFSRLENPEALANLRALPARDSYLAAMLRRPSSPAEMYQMVGVTKLPPTASGAETDDTAPSSARGEPAPAKVRKAPASDNSKPTAKAAAKATPAATPKPGFFQRLVH